MRPPGRLSSAFRGSQRAPNNQMSLPFISPRRVAHLNPLVCQLGNGKGFVYMWEDVFPTQTADMVNPKSKGRTHSSTVKTVEELVDAIAEQRYGPFSRFSDESRIDNTPWFTRAQIRAWAESPDRAFAANIVSIPGVVHGPYTSPADRTEEDELHHPRLGRRTRTVTVWNDPSLFFGSASVQRSSPVAAPEPPRDSAHPTVPTAAAAAHEGGSERPAKRRRVDVVGAGDRTE